jgi:hypothetical protein
MRKINMFYANAGHPAAERRSVNRKRALASDQTIRLTGIEDGQCPHLLKRIGYRVSDTGRHHVLFPHRI